MSESRPPSQLQKELKQNAPFASPAEEGIVSLFRTADLVRRSATEALEPTEVSLAQYNVLRILRGAGDRGLPILAIAGRLVQETPGITRFIDRLESLGLLTRHRCSQDRRRVYCKITPEGLDVVESMTPVLTHHNARCMSALSDSEQVQLINYLDRIRAKLTRTETENDS